MRDDDVVLIDCGCLVEGYASDLTRTYVHGRASPDVKRIWAIEHEAQAAAFSAAQLGTPCETVDDAARAVLERHGLGPGYELPGLPHRTGHGVGLDLHEHPYLVRGNAQPLEIGMCCSSEPMIVVPGAFGVRLEDHFYMTCRGRAGSHRRARVWSARSCKPLAQGVPWSVPRGDGDARGVEPQAHRHGGPARERPGARPAVSELACTFRNPSAWDRRDRTRAWRPE